MCWMTQFVSPNIVKDGTPAYRALSADGKSPQTILVILSERSESKDLGGRERPTCNVRHQGAQSGTPARRALS